MRTGTFDLLPAAGDWWQLPSGRTVSVRRIDDVDGSAEAVVRYVDEQGALGMGEFNLTLSYIARGRRVGRE